MTLPPHHSGILLAVMLANLSATPALFWLATLYSLYAHGFSHSARGDRLPRMVRVSGDKIQTRS
jgi:hypothetical protein